MGASQSSSHEDDAHEQAENGAKTSYYELLGVERLASDEEIKKAYRRKALELHPDRNYGNVENTTKQFADVQSAYEVLSDPHERAWYDSHESSILNGEPAEATQQYAHNVKITTADEIVRMMGQFRGNVEFSDKPSGFYGFLRETFEKLAREEQAVAQWEGLESIDYPSFGHKDDDYGDVVKTFYAMWNGFATKKTFSWKDKWRYSEAPDRRVRRLMEKENKKIREEAIREFNDAVRALVAFVRKRDPRYIANTQSEADRQQALREAAAAQAAKSRAENMAKMGEADVPEWVMAREPDELVEIEDEESEEEHYECMACRKTFKSEKQFAAHEKSKKHIKAVQNLRRQLQKEGRVLDLDDDRSDSGGIQTPLSDEHTEEYDIDMKSKDDKPDSGAHNELALDDEDEQLVKETQELSLDGESSASDELLEPQESVNSEGLVPADTNTDLSEDNSKDPAGKRVEPDDFELEDAATPPNPAKSPAIKIGKAAQKRAKKAAQQQAASKSDQPYQCIACAAAFPSKTRLFQHLEDFGHAQPVSKAAKSGKTKKK